MEGYKKEYMEYYRAKGCKAGMMDIRGRSVRAFIEYIRESRINRLEEVDAKTLEGFRDYLLRQAGITGLPAGKNTLKAKLESVRHFLLFLRDKKGITARALPEAAVKREEARFSEIPAGFREAFDGFMEQKRRENTPENSFKRFRYVLKDFFRYLTEERHIQSLTELRREDVKNFTGYLIEKRSLRRVSGTVEEIDGGASLSMSSVNVSINVLRLFLKWLSKNGKYSNCYNLQVAVRRVKEGDRVSRNIFTRKELAALFNRKAGSPPEFMMKTMFVLLYASGLRCGELLELKLSDVDFEKKEAVVYEPKTKKERIVQLGEVGTAYLRLYLERVRPGICRDGTNREQIFVTRREHGRLWIHSVNDALKKFALKAGIKKVVSSHSFRHSYGTHILENGAGVKEVSELLGHDSIETTQNYTRLAPERLRETLLKFHPREKA